MLIRIIHVVIVNAVIVVIVVRIGGDGISMANVADNNTFGGCRRWTSAVQAHIHCPCAIGGHCDAAHARKQNIEEE